MSQMKTTSVISLGRTHLRWRMVVAMGTIYLRAATCQIEAAESGIQKNKLRFRQFVARVPCDCRCAGRSDKKIT